MIYPFSLLFNSLFLILLTFSQEMSDFSQNCGFFGEAVGKALFCFIFRSTFAASKKQDNAELFSVLESPSYIYIICILRL